MKRDVLLKRKIGGRWKNGGILQDSICKPSGKQGKLEQLKIMPPIPIIKDCPCLRG